MYGTVHTMHIIIDRVSHEPLARVVCVHDDVDKGCREEADGVRVVAHVGEDLAVEVDGVHVHLVAHA